MRAAAVVAVLALSVGCYRSHVIERDAAFAPDASDAGIEALDAGLDGGDDAGDASLDAGPGPCTTQCDTPRLVASVSFADALLEPWAILDVAPVGDSLIALTVVGDLASISAGTRVEYRLLHIPLVDGAPRFEGHESLHTDQAITGGSLRAVGEGYRLVVVSSGRGHVTAPQEVSVVIATWSDLGGAPEIMRVPLSDTAIPGCVRCYRHGAAVLHDDVQVIAAVAGDGEMRVARIAFADLSVERWNVSLPDASADAPMAGASDSAGRTLLTVGGSIAEFRGSGGGAAYALSVEGADADLGSLLALPGALADPPPHAVLFADRAEIVRFGFTADSTTGAIRRWVVADGVLAEQAMIETGAGLPPFAMTSTPSVLFVAEADLTLPGSANLRALAHLPGCTSERSALVAHLPAPLADLDPRVIAATERDGRTYVVVIEHPRRGEYRASVLDFGRCYARR